MNSKLYLVPFWSGTGRRVSLPEDGCLPMRRTGSRFYAEGTRMVKTLLWEGVEITGEGLDAV